MWPLVELHHISKSFGGKKVNSNVNLTLEQGETLALLGENGAGKSTLMNVLCGIYQPDQGKILINGNEMKFNNPQQAIDAGIGMVHQHFMLVPALTVWENIVLGTDLPLCLPQKKLADDISNLSDCYGLKIDPNAYVWQLSVGEQQRVAILKALYRKAKILILDEPTAVLTPQEAEALFKTIRRMNQEGRGVIFISHKLDEVFALSQRILILRNGKVSATLQTSDTNKEEVAQAMMGSAVQFTKKSSIHQQGRAVIELSDATLTNEQGLKVLDHISFSLHEGEILGLAGISGNGQVPLCEAMVGLRQLTEGEIKVFGQTFNHKTVRDFLDQGLRYIPADRRGVGMVGNMNAIENSALRRYREKTSTFGMDWKNLWQHAKSIIQNFNVSTPSEHAPVRNLSGGNLQKLMMGRELSDHHRVLIAMNPTWGLDIAASKFVRDRLLEEKERGLAVFLASEDLDELIQLSDRLLVIYRGAIMTEILNPSWDHLERIGYTMAGVKEDQYEI